MNGLNRHELEEDDDLMCHVFEFQPCSQEKKGKLAVPTNLRAPCLLIFMNGKMSSLKIHTCLAVSLSPPRLGKTHSVSKLFTAISSSYNE